MPSSTNWTADSITLRGTEVAVKSGWIEQSELQFYPDNPRLYTIVRSSGESPSQEGIEQQLIGMDHVKQLVQTIRANNGLIDPILVRDGDLMVLEGNSRLAAYRLLAKNDPVKWGLVKVTLLPDDISPNLVFALLGEYHLIGKKDWAPYEQAGYFYRRHHDHGIALEEIAKDMGISKKRIQHLVDVYQFMLDRHESDTNRWSYYDEYFKNVAIRKARHDNPSMDEVVVRKIRSGEIPRAIDIRDRLGKIAKAGGKSLTRFLREDDSFQEAYELTADRNIWFERFNRLRKQLATGDFEREIPAMTNAERKRCIYELKKIEQAMKVVIPKLERSQENRVD